MGVTSDIGTLQWFPKIVGNDSLARELILTARPFDADVAKQIGFVRYRLSIIYTLLERLCVKPMLAQFYVF